MEDDINNLLNHNGQMENLFSGWVGGKKSFQYGGHGDIPWRQEERDTTARVLGLDNSVSDVSDDDIVKAFKSQMTINNWPIFVIKDVMIPLQISIEDNDPKNISKLNMKLKLESVFKYFWLLCMSMAYGKYIVKLVDDDMSFRNFDNIQETIHKLLQYNLEQNGELSLEDAYAATFNQKELNLYFAVIYKNNKNDNLYYSLKNNALVHANTILWPCQIPAISPTTFLKYYFYEVINNIQPFERPYCIVPISLLSTIKIVPHLRENNSPYAFFYHDISHVTSIMLEGVNFKGFDFNLLKRAVNFMFKEFDNNNKKIIQFWCIDAMFHSVHELSQLEREDSPSIYERYMFVCPLVYGGWKHFFTGPNHILYPESDNVRFLNILERLFVAKAVQALQNQTKDISTCTHYSDYMSTLLENFQYSTNDYVQPTIIQKLFNNEPPMIVKTGVHRGPSYVFENAVFNVLNCLVENTEFDESDEFDWDIPPPVNPTKLERIYRPYGGKNRRTKRMKSRRSKKRKTQRRKRRRYTSRKK
jgi:hypothetical protein